MKTTKREKGTYKVLVKRSTAGLGLFAGEPIPKNAYIIEYTGRVLSKEEEYTVNSQYLMEVSSRKTIDGSIRSNVARYINHSCAPNSEAESDRGRVFIKACRVIKEGEEISYDYGKDFWDEYIKPKGCKCMKCR